MPPTGFHTARGLSGWASTYRDGNTKGATGDARSARRVSGLRSRLARNDDRSDVHAVEVAIRHGGLIGCACGGCTAVACLGIIGPISDRVPMDRTHANPTAVLALRRGDPAVHDADKANGISSASHIAAVRGGVVRASGREEASLGTAIGKGSVDLRARIGHDNERKGIRGSSALAEGGSAAGQQVRAVSCRARSRGSPFRRGRRLRPDHKREGAGKALARPK